MIRLSHYGKDFLSKKGLTSKEIEVCEKLLNYDNLQDVSDSVFVCIKTVKFHLTSIYKKLGIKKIHGLLLFLFPLALEWIEPETSVEPVSFESLPEVLPIGNCALFDSKK